MSNSFVVAILHADETVRASLTELLAEEGYAAVAAPLDAFTDSPEQAVSFLKRHDPRVIVYDISPGDESADLLAFLTEAVTDSAFVLTTTAEALPENVPLLREAIDLRSCPHATEELVEAVRYAGQKAQRAA